MQQSKGDTTLTNSLRGIVYVRTFVSAPPFITMKTYIKQQNGVVLQQGDILELPSCSCFSVCLLSLRGLWAVVVVVLSTLFYQCSYNISL